MVTSRSVPQHTAQIFSALAGQKRSALRCAQLGQVTVTTKDNTTNLQNTVRGAKRQKYGEPWFGHPRERAWSQADVGASLHREWTEGRWSDRSTRARPGPSLERGVADRCLWREGWHSRRSSGRVDTIGLQRVCQDHAHLRM